MVQITMQKFVENYEEAVRNLIFSKKKSFGETSTGFFYRGNSTADYKEDMNKFSEETTTAGVALKKEFQEGLTELIENYYGSSDISGQLSVK